MRGKAFGKVRLVIVIAGLSGAAAAALSQVGDFRGGEPEVHNVSYDGRFTFARIRFANSPAGYYYKGLPAWAHGYPDAELNLMKIIHEVSNVDPHLEGTNVFTLDDPELCRYPVAFMTEGGWWDLTDKEAAAFRAYLRKGGFVIFDDFRDDFYRGGGGWPNFESNMKRVLPEARVLDLEPSHPIFHSFFEIDSFDIVPQFYDRGQPVFRAIFEDNDPHKRMLAVINFNTDISNFWEYSALGFRPVPESNEAYKLGVNYLIYSIAH
jgi:uncharacterized protein DUF4159